MRSVAFFNNKGGVGKTTLLCNVAAYLALHNNLKICVIDADPQCNATQYFFDDDTIDALYEDEDRFTIYKVIEPLSHGMGYSENFSSMRASRFGLDVIPGDPKLALTEDLLASDWGDAKAGTVRGIRTNLVFSELLSRLNHYDYVFFDVSPSLGAINRSILLSADYFLSPMSIDIFSLRAFENIAEWINDWTAEWQMGISNVKNKELIPELRFGFPIFLGYVTQQYIAKRDASGNRRAVQAFESIIQRIDGIIKEHFESIEKIVESEKYEIGTVPNLYSLVPMSQSRHTPIFELQARDGVVGAHFAKVKDAKVIFRDVSNAIIRRISND